MKTLLSEYGSTIIITVVVAVLIAFMIKGTAGKGGLFQSLSNAENTTLSQNASNDSYNYKNAVKKQADKGVPVVQTKSLVKRGSDYKLTDLFFAANNSPTKISSVVVTKCTKFDDTNTERDVTKTVSGTTNYINFPEEGVYKVTVHIEGANGTSCVRKIQIGVSS